MCPIREEESKRGGREREGEGGREKGVREIPPGSEAFLA